MRKLIIFLFALTFPLGDLLNVVLGFNVSIAYTIVVIISVIFLIILPKVKIYLPKEFIWLYIFIILHVFYTYAIRYPGTLTNLCEIEVYNVVISQEPYYFIVLRYFLYLFSPIILAIYISNNSLLTYFFKCFIACFIVSIAISYSYNFIILNNVRFSGGFHDPNTFGGFSLISLFACLYLKKEKSNKLYILLSVFFLICIIVSESRSSIVGLILAVIYLYRAKYISRNTFWGMLLLSVLIIIYMISNNIGVVGRFSQISKREDGDSRLIIWGMYLNNLSDYIGFGTGLGHKFDASMQLSSNRSTHNMYLLQLVQFGIIGFILFMRTTYILIKEMNKYSREFSHIALLTAIPVAFLVLYFFSDYDNTREYAIVTSIYFIAYNFDKKGKLLVN